jgi:ParB family chromosome partitioning protein
MNTIVPVTALDPSPQNVRKSGGKSIAELAANIHAVGLLHNLVVRSGIGGRFEVVDGHRRLAALKRLIDDKRLPADFKAPCRLIASNTDEGATEASLSANTMSEAMHPADQFEAFRTLVAGGRPIADVAAHFGVTELVVERRLRLANVADELLDAFREDKLSLELMMAFAITDDHAAQLAVWHQQGAGKWRIDPGQVRRLLARSDIPTTDKRVRLIGLERYEAAGGALRRDLFDDAGGGYVLDEPLLDRLVAAYLEEKGEEVKAEGWSFVKVLSTSDAQSFEWSCNRSEAQRVATAEHAATLTALREREAELDKALNEDDVDDSIDYDQVNDELDDVRSQIEALEAAGETYTDRQKAKAGAVVSMGHDGNLRIVRGLIPIAGEKAAKSVAADAGGKAAPKPATLAEMMIRRLTAHRTIAVQAGLLANANVALAVLAHALLDPLLSREGASARHTALHVSATLRLDQPGKFGFDDVSNSPHYARTQAAIAELRETLKVPTRRAELLPWLLQQNRDTVVALLAAVAVMTVDTVQGHEGASPADALLTALDLDLADYWQPTAATFFGIVPRALALQALEEVAGKKASNADGIDAMKKEPLAGYLESKLSRSGWLPKPLRRSGYKLRNANAAAADATPAAPAKKTKPMGARTTAVKTAAAAKKAKKPAGKKPAAKKTAPKKAAKAKARRR